MKTPLELALEGTRHSTNSGRLLRDGDLSVSDTSSRKTRLDRGQRRRGGERETPEGAAAARWGPENARHAARPRLGAACG